MIRKVVNTELVVTVDAMKTYMSIDGTHHDTVIQDLILGCQNEIEEYCWTAFLETEYLMYLESWSDDIRIYHAPLIEVTNVKYYDSANAEQTLDPANYVVSLFTSPATIRFINPSPEVYDRKDAIFIEYKVGYADADSIPAGLKKILRRFIQYSYDNPSSSEMKFPLDIERALYPWRNYRFDV